MALFAKFRERMTGNGPVAFDSLEHITQKEDEKSDDFEKLPSRYSDNSNVSVFTKERRGSFKENKSSMLIDVVPIGNSENIPPSNRIAPPLSIKSGSAKEATYNTLEKKSSFRIEKVPSSESNSNVSTPRTQDNRFATSRSNSFVRPQGTQAAAPPINPSLSAHPEVKIIPNTQTENTKAKSRAPEARPSSPVPDSEVDDVLAADLIETIFSKVRHNRTEAVISAIDQGFNVNSVDTYGNTILHVCAQNNLRKLASTLLQRYPQIQLNTENLKGLTALDYADKYGFEKVSTWLIGVGAEHGGAHAVTNKMSKLR